MQTCYIRFVRDCEGLALCLPDSGVLSIVTYRLTLTRADIDAIAHVSQRGYATRVWNAYVHSPLAAAGCPIGGCDHEIDCSHDVTIAIPEALAWEIVDEHFEQIEAGHSPFGPVCDSLTDKLLALCGEVV